MDFSSNSMLMNFFLFGVGAAGIWLAGTKLERYADRIAAITGLGKAFLGVVLLATATSLPEIATSFTSTISGNLDLAVHNLLGGVVMQTAVLAVADLIAGHRALTGQAPHFALLMQGVGLIFVLATALIGTTVSHVLQEELSSTASTVLVFIWAAALFGSFLFMLLWAKRGQSRPSWQPKPRPGSPPVPADTEPEERPEDGSNRSLRTLSWLFAGASLIVLVGGWLVARTGEALAEQTGLGATFVGFTLVAIATSLPEISTTASAVRFGNYESAVSNIYGSNAFDVTLLAPVAILAGGNEILEAMTRSASFAAALGILLTSIYLWGLLERRDETVWRLGWDSAAVVILAMAGNLAIYLLQ